ncbi:ATP-binding protein [Phenylobacterium sp.]|uniref:sensor histidine kinase n=1 Tax=Phenylobacterium sp. TaxID=1871053 RepID=UPI0035B33CE3
MRVLLGILRNSLVLAGVGLALVALLLVLATAQPWLGLRFSADGAMLGVQAVPDGPAAQAVKEPTPLQAVRLANGEVLKLEPGDLVEEPDTLASYAHMRRFFARQTALASALREGPVELVLGAPGAEGRAVQVTAQPRRPLSDLPSAFWVQLAVGAVSFLMGAWVLRARPDTLAPRLFALASFGILGFTFPAALYSTREIALDGRLFAALSAANHFGALLFGATMIALLLVYPRRLVLGRWFAAPLVIFGLWWAADTLRLPSGPAWGANLPTLIEMIAILVCAGVQYWRAGADPAARTILRWFGLAIAVGAGGFVFPVVTPHMLGEQAVVSQGYGFLSFLIIHLGIAIGVARYRLFELDRWAFRILFYLVGAALLLALDALLISAVSLARIPAFGLSLALIAVLYLPLRDHAARWVLGRREIDRARLAKDAIAIALSPGPQAFEANWRNLLDEVFEPLEIVPAELSAPVGVTHEGRALAVPALGGAPALRLEHPRRGRRLFNSGDGRLADEICAMLANAIDGRRAYERGVAEERRRIARDMHDNIGVQLMGALHSQEPLRKDRLVREALADLRNIINDAGADLALPDLLADLRLEFAELLAARGIAFDWRVLEPEHVQLAAPGVQTLRAILREAVSNAFRHGEPSRIAVQIVANAAGLLVEVSDDGRGFELVEVVRGNGLSNMRQRMEALGGRLTVLPSERGVRVQAQFPLSGGRA